MGFFFEAAERGPAVSRSDRKLREPELRHRLLEAQALLAERAEFPVIIVFGGVDGAGKGDLANRLSEWMDPRRIATHAYGDPTQEEQERPEYWRFWRDLPAKGYTGIFLSAWYHKPLIDRAYEEINDEQLDAELEKVLSFERELVADGALILKFWMHLEKDQEELRLRSLEADPLQAWRVTPHDWKHWRMYDRFMRATELLIDKTSTEDAPWHVIDSADVNYRELTVGDHVLAALTARLSDAAPAESRG